MYTKEKQYYKTFKALSDPNRLYILQLLKEKDLCACDLLEQLEMSQSTLSHHMKILVDANLVTSKKQATWIHYSLFHEELDDVINYLTKLKQ